MFGKTSPEGFFSNSQIDQKNESLHNDEKSTLVNISASFDDNTFAKVQEELNQDYEKLKDKELEYFGITLYFYESYIPGYFVVNFRKECLFEELESTRTKILEMIQHFQGKILE